jgi:thiamine biosynthesis protein ThiS
VNAYFMRAMKIQLNGASAEVAAPLTLSGLLSLHKLKPETVVVEHNLRVPPKDEYDTLELAEGDRVEIVKFMGGG